MTSITTFGYGLTVRATDLISASLAWPSLGPTFHFFDLLLLRKRNRSLRVRNRDEGKENRIERVPVEVWDEVKDWVVLVEMENAEDAFLRPLLDCVDCDCDCLEGTSDIRRWEILSINSDCCHTLVGASENNDALRDALSALISGLASEYKLVHRLVAAFGLAHPLTRPLTPNSQYLLTPDAVALVTIPSQIENTPHTTISAEAGVDGPDQHTLIDVSLDLPDDADLRFTRFIRTFHLPVVEVSDAISKCGAPNHRVRANGYKGFSGIKRKQVRMVKEIKPKWKLYTSCLLDW